MTGFRCTVIFCVTIIAHAQEVPVPPRPQGYVYAYSQSNNLTDLQLDAFFDPLCPDSKQAFPTLLQVANHYGPDVLTLRLHMFPLPYHRNSFLASMGTEAVYQLASSPSAVFDWVAKIYDNIYPLSNAPTKHMSETDVTNMLGDIAAQLGIQKSQFLYKMADAWVDMNIRMDWKYGCTRGVSGTPLYAINGVVKVIDKAWSLTDWIGVLDPLVHKSLNFGISNTEICNTKDISRYTCSPGHFYYISDLKKPQYVEHENPEYPAYLEVNLWPKSPKDMPYLEVKSIKHLMNLTP